MKMISVKYGEYGISYVPDANIGYQYDNNAAQLQITPPEISDVSFYRLDWKLPDGTLHSTEDLYQTNGVILYTIPSGLTVSGGILTAQLKAFRADSSEIVMQTGSEPLKLLLLSSVAAGDAPPETIDPLAQSVAQAIDAAGRADNAAARLTNISFSMADDDLILEVPD